MEAKDKSLREKKRIVVKVGSSSITHDETGGLNFSKLEKLVRQLCDLRNQGRDVCLVSSGAIAVGRSSMGIKKRPEKTAEYQRMFAEYHQTVGQVLLTKSTMSDNVSRLNAQNTFEQLFEMGVIPIVNENDTISTYEMEFGDNDTLSALVASLTSADLLILLSDIDGLYTDDPRSSRDARLIREVTDISEKLLHMAKESTGSDVGTGGMATKLTAARIATQSGADMIIANGKDVGILHDIFDGEYLGTFFHAKYNEDFYISDFVETL